MKLKAHDELHTFEFYVRYVGRASYLSPGLRTQ